MLLAQVSAHSQGAWGLICLLAAKRTLAERPNIFESDGAKYVRFDVPLPNLAISSEQMQTLFAVAPDRQIPSTLIHVQNFVASHRQRVVKYGSDPLPIEFVKRQIKQLQFMLLSVRTQYEQAANDAFPLD